MNLTLKQYLEKVKTWELLPQQVVSHYLAKAKNLNKDLNAFVRFHDEYIEQNLNNLKDKPLKAAPIWIKDIILTKWYVSSCASRMLENYVSPYSATCFQNLESAWWLMIWKANMDEYAMWWSTTSSYFWNTINPWGTNRIPWGSSWWSAAAVAADMCIAALWTDTWGSIRQPASFCGIVWLKPTYGRVSRYGVQAMASSLDQVGPMTKTVEDNLILLKAIAWYDDNDSNSVKIDDYQKIEDAMKLPNLKWFKIALPKQYFEEWLDPKVKQVILNAVEKAKELWAQVDWIDFPLLKYALAVYYIVMPAEVSTNLARFDGIKFWFQEDSFDKDSIYDYYSVVRAAWFWAEPKRRIMIWTYVLSAWYYDAYYVKAQRVRNKIMMEFNKYFEQYDLILWPVSPTVAWKLDEKMDDPMANYLADIYTITVNLIGIPAMSLPVWFAEDRWEKMPVWLHILAKHWAEDKIYWFANLMEKNMDIDANFVK